MIDRKGYFCFRFTRKLTCACRELISDCKLIFDLEVKCSIPTKNKQVMQHYSSSTSRKILFKMTDSCIWKKWRKVHQQYIHWMPLYSALVLKSDEEWNKIVFYRSWKTNITFLMRPRGRCHGENTFTYLYMITKRNCSFCLWRLKWKWLSSKGSCFKHLLIS